MCCDCCRLFPIRLSSNIGSRLFDLTFEFLPVFLLRHLTTVLCFAGRSYSVFSQRMLNQCLESLVQKIQSGVVINFEKTGPDPPPLEGKRHICLIPAIYRTAYGLICRRCLCAYTPLGVFSCSLSSFPAIYLKQQLDFILK